MVGVVVWREQLVVACSSDGDGGGGVGGVFREQSCNRKSLTATSNMYSWLHEYTLFSISGNH
jgi:hypothetical protein